MKKYYQMIMTINLNHVNSINNLAKYYIEIEKNYNKAIKYILMLIKLSNSNGYTLFEKIKNNINLIDFYNQVSLIEEKNDEVNKITNELVKNKDVKIYQTKINFAIRKNLRDDCFICLDTNKIIYLFDCMHWVCSECYPVYKDCAICKLNN
jgi:hypothetical protein